MLKENVGKGNQYAQIGNNDADEIYNKFNTLNMDETEHQYTQDFVLNKREMNARMVYAYNEKNIPYNDTSMDIIFNKLINNLKTNQNDLDRNINTVDKEKISKIEFKTFKNLNEQYLIKDLNKIKDNEESKIKANNKPNHDNSISAINPIPYNKSKTENKSKNLFATISKVNTNDHCSFKSKNDIKMNPELDDNSEENEDDIKINKGSTFDKSYTHKKRKISKELQLHQEYAKKKFISVENISRNKDKNLYKIDSSSNSNTSSIGMKLAERSDSRGVSVRNINVNKKNPCVGKMNGLKYEEILSLLKEKLKKTGINYKQENYNSNFLLIFDIPNGSLNKHYELLIQNGNNKILEYKKTRGKEIIYSVLNKEESSEKIILEDLSSLNKELEYSVYNKMP